MSKISGMGLVQNATAALSMITLIALITGFFSRQPKIEAPRKLKQFFVKKKLKAPDVILRIGPQKLQFKLNFLTKCVTKLLRNLIYLQLQSNFGQKVPKTPLISGKAPQKTKEFG